MKLNFDIKYKQDENNPIAPIEASYNLISASVSLTHKDGLEGQVRRMYGRIQRKFDEAIDTEKEIELDDNELDFIKKSLKDAKFPPNLSYNIMLLEDYLDEDEKDKFTFVCDTCKKQCNHDGMEVILNANEISPTNPEKFQCWDCCKSLNNKAKESKLPK